MPAHPLWRELQLAIIDNGGNLAALFIRIIERPKARINDQLLIALPAWPTTSLSAWPTTSLSTAAFATGPP